jgi:2-methylcitrate dehydratase PrpD
MQRHAVDADHIASIVVAGPSLVGMYMTQAPFATGTQAKYSLPYCAAVAAFDEQVGQPSFEADRLADARLIDLSERVAFQVDDVLEQAFPESFSIKVTITTRGGGAWTSHQFPKWSAERPPSFDELAKKFTGILQDKCSKSIAERWIDYFQRGLRADASMHGFFDLMRASVVHA